MWSTRIKSSESTSANNRCRNCPHKSLCIPQGLTDRELETFQQAFLQAGPYAPGKHVARQGEPLKAIYVVRSGSIKTYSVDGHGREHVWGFYLPGEIFGLEAVAAGRQLRNAVALEHSTVCILIYDGLVRIAHQSDVMRTRLLYIMSQGIGYASLFGDEVTAKARVARFLVNLFDRWQARGDPGYSFNLNMRQHDIGAYLRLRAETVSRIFVRLQKSRLIHMSQRRITLLNPARLRTLAGTGDSL